MKEQEEYQDEEQDPHLPAAQALVIHLPVWEAAALEHKVKVPSGGAVRGSTGGGGARRHAVPPVGVGEPPVASDGTGYVCHGRLTIEATSLVKHHLTNLPPGNFCQAGAGS